MVNTSFPLPENITLLGTDGRPIISAQGPYQPTHLFEGRALQKVKFITMKVKNLIFRGIGILRLTKEVTDNNISFLNCYFKNILVTSNGIIRIESHPHKPHTGLIYFRQCHFESNVGLESSISIMYRKSLFQECHFKNNRYANNGAVFLKGGFSTFRNSNFEKNTPLIKHFYLGLKDEGGAIRGTANSNIEILECYFKENQALHFGGAIFIFGNKLVIRSSSFENNTAMNKYQSNSRGGAVFVDTEITSEVLNCSFIQNEATLAGGAISTVGKTLVIKSSLFEYNVGMRGGAIHASANAIVEILECYFKGNEALRFGGAISIFGKKLVIRSSLFENNTAMSKYQSNTRGGAVFVNTKIISEVLNCSFSQNEATLAGGAISTQGKILVIKFSIFEYNAALTKYTSFSWGGAVYSYTDSILEILNCSFKWNKATSGEGAVSTNGKTLTIKSSLFEYNVGIRGGAVYTAAEAIIEILECHFKGNEGTPFGGAIFIFGKKLIITSSLFENNTVVNKNQSITAGGAAFLHTDVATEILNCSFNQNEATFSGGAIATTGKTLIIKSSLFKHNVGMRGGAIHATPKATVEILECHFKGNKALRFGGAIFILGKKLVIKTSLFEDNTAANKYQSLTRGGAVFVDTKVTSEVRNCSFNQNQATYAGGAIFAQGKKLVIKFSLFEYNAALTKYTNLSFGGAVSSDTDSALDILNCSFQWNKAAHIGGAIFSKGKNLTIKSSLFEYNVAVKKYITKYFLESGGAVGVWTNYSFGIILNCVFRGNKAIYGGAVSISGNKQININIESSLFEYNVAKTAGGAVFCMHAYSVSFVKILNCSFKRNEAPVGFGGAVYHRWNTTNIYTGREKNLVIKSSLFEFNTAKHGGAVSTVGDSKAQFMNCSFQENKAAIQGGAISANGNTLVIKNSPFADNKAALQGGAIVASKNTLVIKSSLFHNNTAEYGSGGAISFFGNEDSICNILNCSFKNNSVRVMGGAIFVYALSSSSIISGCFFSNNKVILNGGAVSHSGKDLVIRNTKFHNNIASGMSGEGGALFTEGKLSTHQVKIFHCIFDGNRASFRGGAIMTSTSRLHIRNSSLRSSSSHPSEGYLGGDLLYSKSIVILEHVSFIDVNRYNRHTSLIVHQNSLTKFSKLGLALVIYRFSLKVGVQIKCFTGKEIVLSSHTFKYPNTFSFFSVSCSFCSQNSYSLYTSHIDLLSQNQSIEKTNAKCYHCPSGGICEKGKVRAADNFWGYNFGEQVHFASCPFGYCCYKEECLNYSSCHIGRRGNLCGQCQEGFTESIFTPDCLLPEQCHHPLYFLVVIITGIIYVTVFMYLNEIMKILKSWLIPKSILEVFNNSIRTPISLSETCKFMWKFAKSKVSINFHQDRQMQYLTDDVLFQEHYQEDVFESMPENIYLPSDDEMQLVLASQKDNEGSFFPGLMKIMLFFYQTNILFKVYTGSRSHGFVHKFQEVISTLFNLRTDGLFTQDLAWCPFNHLNPVSKVLFKSSFIFYLLLLNLLAFILCKAGKLLKIISTDISNSRLTCCTLRLIFISYAGITTACFSLLSCIRLGDYGIVLFIDGSVQCYKWWQMFLIFIVCVWIVPFPITIYTSSQMLHNKMLSMKQFCLCLLFPLPAVCYWLYKCHSHPRKEIEDREEPNQDAQDALKIIEGPFRKGNHCNTVKNYRLSWESILIGRRLILILIRIFIINTFVRLFTMLLGTIIFLIHHIYTKPFSSNLLNNIETLSLFMLTVICLLNLVPAYNYAYPIHYYDHIHGVIKILKDTETVLNLVFPVLVGILVAALICIRIFQFFFWLCLCLVNFIRFCTKYKLS